MNEAHEPRSEPGRLSVNFPQPSRIDRDPRVKSAVLASILSVLPGLGQVYVGYYRRGFIHALVAGAVFSLLIGSRTFTPLHPMGIIFLIFFCLYNIIDAGRRATLYNLHLAGVEEIELPRDFQAPQLRGSLAGGLTLIAVGGILLSYTRFGMSLDWVEQWWPVAPILFGLYLLLKAFQERSREAKA